MTQAEESNRPTLRPGRHNRLRPVLLIGGPVLVLIAAVVIYLTSGRYVSTDDAFVQAARVDISTNIPGRITEVDVRDNEVVHKGQVLLKLDPRRYDIAVADARAALDLARSKIMGLEAAYRQRQADQRAGQDAVNYQQREFDRETKLAAAGIASKAQLDQAAHDLQAARDRLASAAEQTAAAEADLGGRPDAPLDDRAAVRQAQAALDRAKLDLSYTVVHAPIDAVAAKVEQVQPGDYINAAQPLFGLVSQHDVWVEANFKETDLTYMRQGQSASFKIDAYPDRTLKGVVGSTSPGTGSSFALLPPENSSGNWVKVVQRLPVRLSIDPRGAGGPLAAGMSVRVKVDTQHHRSLFGGGQ